MPIRTQRGRASAYRSVWQWPLRSPLRLAGTLAALAAVAVGVTMGTGALQAAPVAEESTTRPDRPSGPSWEGGSARTTVRPTPTPTALPPVPELTPSALPLEDAPPEALDVAGRWAASWLRPAEGTTAAQWAEGLRPVTTDEYFGVLSGVDPTNIPATRLAGAPRPLRVAPQSVEVEVPTDTVVLRLLVVDTETGWRVSAHDRA